MPEDSISPKKFGHKSKKARNGNLFPYLWHLSMLSFVIAGTTGFGYRLGLIGFLPFDLGLENIRHAHSHLMFFGWAVPLPLYILLRQITKSSGLHQSGVSLMKNSILLCLIFGLLAYPFFLFYGYQSYTIGTISLPLSVILSGFVMLTWYSFMAGYIRVRDLLKGDISQPWFEGALVMLFICSLGAWAVAVLQALGPDNQLFAKAMTHFFLATFTEGWVVLVVIAVMLTRLKIKTESWSFPQTIPLGCIAIGAPLTFPYGISESLLSPLLLNTARLGGLLAAAGLILILYNFIRSTKLKNLVWFGPVVLLGIKALMQLSASLLPFSFWMSEHALRIFYLHISLLGVLTLVGAGWLLVEFQIPRIYFKFLTGSVLIVLFSLVLLTRLLPVSWSGKWVFYAAAGGAILPVVAIIGQWIKMSFIGTES